MPCRAVPCRAGSGWALCSSPFLSLSRSHSPSPGTALRWAPSRGSRDGSHPDPELRMEKKGTPPSPPPPPPRKAASLGFAQRSPNERASRSSGPKGRHKDSALRGKLKRGLISSARSDAFPPHSSPHSTPELGKDQIVHLCAIANAPGSDFSCP